MGGPLHNLLLFTRHRASAVFTWNDTDLTQFPLQGNSPSFDSGFGNPTSVNGTDVNSINLLQPYSYVAADGSNYFESPQTFQFDWYLDTTNFGGIYNYGCVFFACDSSGNGPCLSLNGSGRVGQGYGEGFFNNSDGFTPFAMVTGGSLPAQYNPGQWYSMRVMLSGTTAMWNIWNGSVWVLIQTATVTPLGQYFGIGCGGGYVGGYATNIKILP